jgi:hypothetical protein
MSGYLVIGHGMAAGFGFRGPGRGLPTPTRDGSLAGGSGMDTNIGGTRDTGAETISETI